MNIKELYQEIILEHGKNPRNLRKTENFNKDAMGKNPLCGDNVHIGTGANVIQGVMIGCGAQVGAGVTLTTDLLPGKKVYVAKSFSP